MCKISSQRVKNKLEGDFVIFYEGAVSTSLLFRLKEGLKSHPWFTEGRF